MKYMCLGYFDEERFEAMTEAERDAFMDACFAYDDVLLAKGHFLTGEGLENARTATTVRVKNGKPFVTDGAFMETKGAAWRSARPRSEGPGRGYSTHLQSSRDCRRGI